jgi:ketosteroid isomerase-like protein
MGTTEAEEVRAAIGEMIDAMNSGDAGRLRSLLSERSDAVHIGTDAGEWWTSKEVLDGVAAGGDGDIQVVADDLEVHVGGDVAWVEGRGRFTNPHGGERPVRMTCVFVREGGRWAVAQSHSSIGIPNAEIFR